MKIGLISDTHDQAELIVKAVEQFNQVGVDAVIHCGDWVSPFILYFFKDLKAPIYGVFGNNDGDKFRHLQYTQKLGLNVKYEDRFLEITFDNRLIAVFHGDYAGIVDALVTCGKYDAVFHGHTHEQVNKTHGKTLSLNPGSLMRETSATVQGPPTIAIYDTADNSAQHINLSIGIQRL
jgi:uncharacterized protein